MKYIAKYNIKRSLKLIVLILFIVFGAILVNNGTVKHQSKLIDKVEIINDDFDDSSVLAVLETENFNRVLKPKLIYNSSVNKIKNLTVVDDYNNALINIEKHKTIIKIELENKSKESVLSMIELLLKIDGVISAGPNYRGKFWYSSQDPFYEEQWYLHGVNGINIEQAWDITRGSQQVKVGVIDSGSYHSDYYSNIDTSLGWDFYNNNSNFSDDIDGHGTHIAGIISSKNNDAGITGVAPNASIVPLQIIVSNESRRDYRAPDLASLISAINYSANKSIPIINISSGFPHSNELKQALVNYSGLIVCAAGQSEGNNPVNLDNVPEYGYFFPAAYDLPNIITVSAIESNGYLFDKSNYGYSTVDLFAPGQNILSTYPENKCWGSEHSFICDDENSHFDYGYHTFSGTSFAAPQVTGVAALILSKYPTIPPEKIKECIISGVTKMDNLEDKCISGGRLNAYKSLILAKEYLDNHDHVYNNMSYGLINSHYQQCIICQKKKFCVSIAALESFDSLTHTYVCEEENCFFMIYKQLHFFEFPAEPNKPYFCIICGYLGGLT